LTEFYNQEPKSQRLEKLYKRVLDTKLRAYDTANPMEVYDSYKKLADLYREREDYDEAAHTYEEALKLIKRSQAQNGDFDLGGALDEILSSLGDLYKIQGSHKKAESYYSQALANQLVKPSPENEDNEALAVIYSNLGEVQKNQGRFDDALKNHNEAIKIYSLDVKKNYKSLAANAIAAGEIHLNRKEYDQAEPYYKQASEVLEKEGGLPEKDQLTASLIKRARINYIYSVERGREESKKYYRQAVNLIKRALATSTNAPRMLDEDLRVLFRTLKEQNFNANEPAKPAKLYEDMLNLYYEAITDSDLTLARSPSDTAEEFIRESAEIYRKQGDSNKLIALFNQALEIRKKTYKGTDNPSVYRTYNDLGKLYQSLGKYVDAEDNYRQALEIVERVFTPDDASFVVDSLNNLAVVCRDQRKYSEAEDFYRRAKSNLEKKGEGESIRMAEVLEGYADVLLKTGRAAEANKMREDARRLRSKQVNMK
jgi:tetratricopeptide (TPR) repeat protein